MKLKPASVRHEERVEDAHSVSSPLDAVGVLVHATLVPTPATGGDAGDLHEVKQLLADDHAVPGVGLAQSDLLVKLAASFALPPAAQLVLVFAISCSPTFRVRIPGSLCRFNFIRNLLLWTTDHHLAGILIEPTRDSACLWGLL